MSTTVTNETNLALKAETLRRELAAMHEKRHGLDEAILRRKQALNRLEARAVMACALVPPRDE
jgi:hypothetical protein